MREHNILHGRISSGPGRKFKKILPLVVLLSRDLLGDELYGDENIQQSKGKSGGQREGKERKAIYSTVYNKNLWSRQCPKQSIYLVYSVVSSNSIS